MATFKRINEIRIRGDILVCFFEYGSECLKFDPESSCIRWGVFPIQPKLDGHLDEPSRDADDTNDPEWVRHGDFLS
jgi:hypothetical protein